MHSHIFTNKNGNTLMREFEGVLRNNQTIKTLDAVVGFLRASGYFTQRPFLDNINKARVLVGINVDKYIAEAVRQGKIFFGAEDEEKEDCGQCAIGMPVVCELGEHGSQSRNYINYSFCIKLV